MNFVFKQVSIILTIVWLLGAGCQATSKQSEKTENKISAQYKAEIERLSKEIERLIKEIEASQKERDELKSLLDDEVKQAAFLKSELENIREKLKYTEQRIAKREDVQPARPRFIRGKIMSIQSSAGVMIISLGKKDSITLGSELEVYRQNKILGKIKIDSVESDWSTAHSVKTNDFRLFKIGDDILLPVTD